MDFYTLLTVIYTVAEHRLQFSIWFPSEEQCWNVLLGMNTIYDQVNGEAGFCDVSEIASNMVKPKLRPW